MDKRFTFFILLSVIILFGSNYLLGKGSKQNSPVPIEATVTVPSVQPLTANPTIPMQPDTPLITSNRIADPQTYTLENDQLLIKTTSLGALLEQVIVKGFSNHTANGSLPVDLVGASPKPAFLGLDLSINGKAVSLDLVNWKVNASDSQRLVFSTSLDNMFLIEKAIILNPETYTGEIQVTLKNASSQLLDIDYLKLNWGPGSGEGDGHYNIKQIGVYQKGKVQWFKPKKKPANEIVAIDQGWIGMKDQYFSAIFYSQASTFTQAEVLQNADKTVDFKIILPTKPLVPNSEEKYAINYYFGPQNYEILKKKGNNLSKIINFGMFSFIAIPMLYLLKIFYSITSNYGFAIILLTLVIRAILWWPTQKSFTSMKKMQTSMNKMQPRLKTLKEVYKDNPAKLNEETMKLYKEYQINPLGGCLPMLLQMPIFFALYSTLSSAVELKGANFIWFWHDLSTKDPYYVLPIAMGLSMFFQQKLSTPPAATPEAAAQQKMMLYLMPAMLTFFSFMWPSGLLLYWVVSNILSITQQILINRKA